MADYRFKIVPLALGTFAIGSEGLVIAGILPDIARGVGVTVSATGQLVTVYAIVYALTGPLLAVFASHVRPKPLLLWSLVVFGAGNILAAFSPSYLILMVSRVLVAASASAFVPSASAAGADLVSPERRGQALALVWGGFTVATVLGVPLGTLIAGTTSWRFTFIFVAVLAGLATLGILALVPPLQQPQTVSARAFGSVVRRPLILGIVAAGVLVQMGQYTIFTYIAPFTTKLTGGGGYVVVAAALLIFGLAAIVGNVLGGVGTDRLGVRRMLTITSAAFAVALAVLWIAGGLHLSVVSLVIAVLALLVWGVAAWAFVPPLQSLLLSEAPDQSGVALSLNNSAFQGGIALGGAMGGYVLVQSGVEVLPLIGAVIVAIAFVVVVLITRHPRPSGTTSPVKASESSTLPARLVCEPAVGPRASYYRPVGPISGEGTMPFSQAPSGSSRPDHASPPVGR